jgi:hypothetical protein
MAQKFTEVRIPFAKMTFSPDVPSTALGPNEYNDGRNVETDVRGIRSQAGDEEILDVIPGTPTFVTGGFRRNGEFWFIVATVEGYWWASNGEEEGWIDITPGGVPIVGYDQATNITEAWNGTVPFFNDTVGPPMFLPDEPGAILVAYSNTAPVGIYDITVDAAEPATQRIIEFNVSEEIIPPPFAVGSYVTIQGVDPRFYDGSWLVVACDGFFVTIECQVVQAYASGGTVGPTYIWNYEPTWKLLSAYFMRLYNTPNVGSILIAGNLTVTDQDDVVTKFPVSVRWSQAFGLNQAPTTWEPTVTNVANELEVPLRGEALDGFPCNGSFFLCSYWDTVQFYPINYATTSAPILGVKLFNQGRGLLSSNCWANTDQMVYGIDARDIWVFDGQSFQAIGNQRVKNWFYNELDPEYVDRVFMEVNTQRNQVEIYYPTATAINGVPNRMLSYRYDLEVWNAPRDVSSATLACESPIWSDPSDSALPQWTSNYGSRTVVYARGVANQQLVQKDQGYSFIDGGQITSEFRRDNIKLLPDYSGKLMVHRILPEVVNMGNNELPIDPAVDTALKGNITVTIEGANSVGSAATQITPVTIPIDTQYPWTQINQNAFRVNNIELSNVSNTAIWMCSATTWQYTQVEDDR